MLDADVHVGNFVEVKVSRLGAGANANHLSYIGDSEVGARTYMVFGTGGADGYFGAQLARARHPKLMTLPSPPPD